MLANDPLVFVELEPGNFRRAHHPSSGRFWQVADTKSCAFQHLLSPYNVSSPHQLSAFPVGFHFLCASHRRRLLSYLHVVVESLCLATTYEISSKNYFFARP